MGAYDDKTKTALVINQECDENRLSTLEDVSIIDVSDKMVNAKSHKTKKNHRKITEKSQKSM